MWHTEKAVGHQHIYSGRIYDVERYDVELETGARAVREVIRHPGGACVVAVDAQDCLLMVRQFRFPAGRELLELPAGKLEPGEDPREGALRELAEETGLEPKTFLSMGESFSSPGIFAEKIHLFFARDLVRGNGHPDDGEFLEVLQVPYDQVLDMVRRGEIKDGKTLAGILKASLLMQEQKA